MISNSDHRQFPILNRCPKCRSGNFNVTTEVAVTTQREVRDGAVVEGPYECALPSDKASYGECINCGHEWRFRDPYMRTTA